MCYPAHHVNQSISVQSPLRIYIYILHIVCGQCRAARQQRFCFSADRLSQQSVISIQREQSSTVSRSAGNSSVACSPLAECRRRY